MRRVVMIDPEEPLSLMYRDHPNGSSHTHRGMIMSCTLCINTSNINYGHHMNTMDPCNVLMIATNSTQWIHFMVYKVR